ncbi:MAG: septum formation initiator family protein [Bacteroidales bacterium]|jgi:cell division protein FtsL|nr:septum formation initiator family protein [Bacteroidales bacterium]
MEPTPKSRSRFKFFAVLFAVTLLLFAAYFFFLSDHNLKTHRDLNQKISNLEDKITNTKNQVGNVYTYEQIVADSELLETYGREQLNMHKPNEDIFVILHE